jgi:hypothetical protein
MGEGVELKLLETANRLEIVSPMPVGRRVLFAFLSLIPLLAPYELIIRIRWNGYLHPFFLLAALICAGALTLTAFLLFAALAGLASQMVFDKTRRTFTYTVAAPVVRRRTREYPIRSIEGLEIVTHDWSDSAPSYSLKVLMVEGQGFNSASSWSREEIENLRRHVLAFLGLPTRVD